MASVVVVGSVAYDSVETPFGKVQEALGGAATYFSVAAGFFCSVRLVGCVGQDFRDEDLSMLESREIDLEGLEKVEGETFRWVGEYGYDLNEAHTLDTRLNVFADFQPTLPEAYRGSEYVFLANIDPALQLKVLSQVDRPRLVACDSMNYWIEDHFDTLLKTLKHVDVLLINDAEARQLTEESNRVKAAQKVHQWGPSTLVVKRGEYGVLMFQRNSKDEVTVFGAPAFPLEDVFDPTGAGDSFAGGFMGYLTGANRSDPDAFRQAIIFGSVMASFNVESFSMERLKTLTFTEIELRYREFKQLTHFDDFVHWRDEVTS